MRPAVEGWLVCGAAWAERHQHAPQPQGKQGFWEWGARAFQRRAVSNQRRVVGRWMQDPKNKLPVMVGRTDVGEVDNDYFLVPLPINDHQGPLENAFPVENRLLPQGLKKEVENAPIMPARGERVATRLTLMHLQDSPSCEDTCKDGAPSRTWSASPTFTSSSTSSATLALTPRVRIVGVLDRRSRRAAVRCYSSLWPAFQPTVLLHHCCRPGRDRGGSERPADLESRLRPHHRLVSWHLICICVPRASSSAARHALWAWRTVHSAFIATPAAALVAERACRGIYC